MHKSVSAAATPMSMQAKQQAAASKRNKQSAAKEEATLATAEQLKQKKVDTTFSVDPLFHKMSALFDEGGAKGEQSSVMQDSVLACSPAASTVSTHTFAPHPYALASSYQPCNHAGSQCNA